MSPDAADAAETLATLRFGARAKKLPCAPAAAPLSAAAAARARLAEVEAENAALRADNAVLRAEKAGRARRDGWRGDALEAAKVVATWTLALLAARYHGVGPRAAV